MISPGDWGCVVSACVRRAGDVAEDPASPVSPSPPSPPSSSSPDRAPGGSDREGVWSCSGLILDRGRGIVLCHGLILLPFLRQPDRDLSGRRLLLAGAFHRDLQIRVRFSGNDPQAHRAFPVSGGDRSAAAGQGRGEVLGSVSKPRLSLAAGGLTGPTRPPHSRAHILLLCSCPEFRRIFQTLFSRSDQWHFYSQEDRQHEDHSHDLVWFGVLRCPGWDEGGLGGGEGDGPRCVRSTSLRKGQALFACASPFASLSCPVFMNTFSKGIVSNLAGEDDAMILTDARCLPGTEGGGVYIKWRGLYYLAGLIVAPLCWKANEWIGLTLVCSVHSLVKNIAGFLKELDCRGERTLSFLTLPERLAVPPGGQGLTRLLGTVALLESGRVWGSGVLISPKLILTCRHVLNGESAVRVKMYPDSNRYLELKGRVLFATKDNSAYDVAVVELEEGLSAVEAITAASGFNTGEDVYIVGYGVFGQRCSASVTSGIVSAVVTNDSQPVMLQTTCAVHAGASGGPIFRKNSGELLGIVSSNARNNTVGACYPHLNFSIPITVLQPLLSVYTQSRDISVFETLNTSSDRLHALWRLQGRLSSLQKSKL